MKLSHFLSLALIMTFNTQAKPVQLNLPGAGPIEFRTQSPIQSLRYGAKIDDPRRHQAGFNRYSFQVIASSIWTQSPEYEMDYYTFDYQLEWEHQWQDGWKTEVSLSQRNTHESRLDQLTLSFHKLFGLNQNDRDTVPKHRYRYWFRDYPIDETNFKNQTFSRAIELLIAKNIFQSNQQSWTVGITGHYENDPRHQGWDHSLRTDYYYSLNAQHQLYSSLIYSTFRSQNFFNILLKNHLITIGLSYEYQPVANRSWVLQYLLNQGATVGLGQLGKPSHEFLIGHRWIRQQHQIEFAMIENLVNPDNSADISFSLTYKYTPKQL